MRARLLFAPVSALALAVGVGWLWPADAPLQDAPTEASSPARRTRTEAPEAPASPGAAAAASGRAAEIQAGRDAILEALHDQLDRLDAEVGLDDTQRDRLETVLTEERTRGFETLDVLRRGRTPGQPPPDGAAIAATMQASRTRADGEARAALDDAQYAAWLRMRAAKAW